MTIRQLLLDFQGRVRRRDVWVVGSLLGIAALLGLLVLSPLIGGRITSLIVSVAVAWPLAALFAKRLHDRGKRAVPWLALYLGPAAVLTVLQQLGLGYIWAGGIAYPADLLPNLLSFAALGASAWGLFECAMLPGEPGPNAFGVDPRLFVTD